MIAMLMYFIAKKDKQISMPEARVMARVIKLSSLLKVLLILFMKRAPASTDYKAYFIIFSAVNIASYFHINL